MGAEISLYDDPSGLAYDDLVAAWGEVDSRSAWFKARLAAAVPKGQLRSFAEDVGVSYATVKDYRLVAEKYPAEKSGRPDFSFGVAKALMTHPGRLELVSREEPWTVAGARQYIAEVTADYLDDPHADIRGQVTGKAGPNGPEVQEKPQVSKPPKAEPGPNGPKPPETAAPAPVAPVAGTVTIIKPAARPDSACPRCAHLEMELLAASERVQALETANGKLSARLSARPDGAGRAAPAVVPQTAEQAADSAHGEPEDPPGARQPCGSMHAARVVIVAGGERQRVMSPDGEELEWLCPEHRVLLADRSGAEVLLAPGGGDFLSFDDAGTCQWPAAERVTA